MANRARLGRSGEALVGSGSVIRRLVDPRHGRVVREARTALANRHDVPLRRQVAAWRRGFYAETTRMYDFDRHGFDAYVSDFERATTLASMNGEHYLLDDKVITYLYLSGVGVPTPALHGFAQDGEVVWLGGHPPGHTLGQLLRQRGRLVVKSRFGSSGSGFALLEQATDDVVLVNGRPVTDPATVLASGALVISEFAVQHERLAAIYPNTTNTLRLMTFRDEETGEPFLAFGSQRLGSKRSEPVDNVSAGGLSAGIDLATGVLRRALMRGVEQPNGYCELLWVEEHPDTGARIAGTEIPHWPELVAGVLRAAAALPAHRYVGWDVVATADGFSILEGNNRADVNIQMHGPLLADERIRRVFAARR
jgi:hypothetical protein